MKDMNEKEILRHVDHTLLSQEAVWDEIRQVCDDAVKYDTASVCIPPSYVKQAAEYVGVRVPICTRLRWGVLYFFRMVVTSFLAA